MTSEQIDALWDFNDPVLSEQRFQEALETAEESGDEIRTQIARTLGLRRLFEEGWIELNKIPVETTAVVDCRRALESGRLKNSSGDKPGSEPYFVHALEVASAKGFDFYAVDAAHMLGIVAPGEGSLEWNQKAISLAEASVDPRAQGWKGSLLNNTGWTYHGMGELEKALDLFKRALSFQQERGSEQKIRIAKWCVGRCLRSLSRFDEALAIQRELEGGPDQGYISEELGELLLVTGQTAESRPYFKRAHELLSRDMWLVANEPERIARLRDFGWIWPDGPENDSEG